MSAEDVGRERELQRKKGGEEERGVNERRYRTLTCFGLISSGGFVLKPLALIWGPQHLELIITHTPAVLRLTVYMAITSTPIQTLYSLCAGTRCYTAACVAVVGNLHKIQLHEDEQSVVNKVKFKVLYQKLFRLGEKQEVEDELNPS